MHTHGAGLSTPAATYDLGNLHGGLRLPAEKTVSTSIEIQHVPIPDQLVLPIQQHVGEPAEPIVGIGEHVLKGQLVADSFGSLSAPVHASSSGKVVAIEPWPVSRRLGGSAPCIIIECDGEDRAIEPPDDIVPFRACDPTSLLQWILQGGIVGLGGAVFPTGQKLMQAATMPLEYLLLNGVECDPYISCDDLLMREQQPEVLGGAHIRIHALNTAPGYPLIASDHPHATTAYGDASAELL
mgnify:CR=1 FL=1